MNGLLVNTVKLVAVLIFVSACTKTRQAELPEDAQADLFAISEIPTTSETSPYQAKVNMAQAAAASDSDLALNLNSSLKLNGSDVNTPERLKFMFDQLPLSNLKTQQFGITFSLEKGYLTAYKIVQDVKDLSIVEKSLAVSMKEILLLTQNQQFNKSKDANLSALLKQAEAEKLEVKSGKKAGVLLVPLFRYAITDYGILQRTKNELKESTSVLALKKTEWSEATHFKIDAKRDSRINFGFNDDASKLFRSMYIESTINNKTMTADELQSQLKFDMKFVDGQTNVFTRLDDSVMHIYEITTFSKLNEQQRRLIKNQAGNQELISCADSSVASFIKTTDKECVLLLKADVGIAYYTSKIEIQDVNGSKTMNYTLVPTPRSYSPGLVQIIEKSPAKQVDISGVLDPNSSIRLSDLSGEFFYRRTFESASNMFLGRTGTSGDMTIIRFELEDNRIVVRNQQSLIQYTGQGPKDREELMSFPVKYIRMKKISTDGAALAIPVAEATTKEKAEYALIDWTKNTIPDSNSPLAFYSGGDCILATSSQKVSDTDMRLATDGVLNFSISGSYTMKPTQGCFAVKDVNSAYWGGSMQFNYNISERISFMKHKNQDSDNQFSQNISSMAQAAFNFGVFTLADKVKENGTLDNRDGSEKYMPIIHDFRKGRKIKYYIGGLNNPEVTSPERRQLIIDASIQVMQEWNKTLRYAFKGTSLERTGDYVDIAVDEGDNTGHLGDLDRNYIWFQELQAENGLLGVAQPAANPRSGTIESANVIVYSGNTYDQTERLLKITALSRSYEIIVENIKKKALADAAKAQQVVSTNEQDQKAAVAADIEAGKVDGNKLDKIRAKALRLNNSLLQSIKALQMDNKNIKALIKNMSMPKSNITNLNKISKDVFQDQVKGQSIDYPVNDSTFLKKITSLVVNKKLTQDPHRFELALNSAFIQFGQLDQSVIEALKTRSEMLAAMIKFDDNTKNRPGCYMYSRNDVNDANLNLDPDPKRNFDLNFKKNIMSTLSHELGHAFGLLHNFKASIDKANYEFGDEKTGRNYSSIMDYIADIDMTYMGPGPYDAHALRAAYTSQVELSDVAKSDPEITKNIHVIAGGYTTIDDVVKASGMKSLVHFTKETMNRRGVLKYFEQCDDGGLGQSSLCAQFDSGGSATEIVQNKIADYSRSYVTRNYVYDKILFSWPQKIQIIQRNISLFQSIRSFLDEALMTAILGSGRTPDDSQILMSDLELAAKTGYTFFHELLRTPDASGAKFNEFNKRFFALPYEYTKAVTDNKGVVTGLEKVKDIKLLEARSLYDVSMSRDKINTVGIGYDKVFAMQFLMQSSAAQVTDDSQVSKISYLDFEQFFMDVKDPSESLTLKTILDILSNDLKSGFFAPSQNAADLQLISTDTPVEINRFLGDQTAVASVISLEESKWKGFDPFTESFKVGRASSKNAPKDRFTVAKAGQDRNLSDTRVYFATQNAVGAQTLITNAAKNEIFVANKIKFFEIMKNMYEADLNFKKPISDMIAKACATNDKGEAKDAAGCKAIQDKKIEDYLKDIPQLMLLKAKADGVAKNLVSVLRNFNSKEVIMSKDLDKADAATNFVRQVEVLRTMISGQISMIADVLATLESTKPDDLQPTIKALAQALSEAKVKNAQLAEIPLFALAQSFIAAATENLSAKLQGDQGIVTGEIIAGLLLKKSALQERYDKQLEVIQQLGTYTGIVDPDTVIQ